MRLIGILFLLFIVGVVLAIKYLPWWAIVGGIVLFVVGGKFFAGRIIEALFKMPFKAKGAVLRSATAEIHSLTPTTRPKDRPANDETDENDASNLADDTKWRFYQMEVTIKPAERSGNGPFQLWAPGEVCLVGPDAKADDTDNDGELCQIQNWEVTNEEGQFVPDEGMKYGGPQRLRLTFAAQTGTRKLQFRYYLELFGTINLPA